MLQIYIMYVKMMVQRRRFYIWYLCVPIVFACLLFFVTKSLSQSERLQTISVGIVNETNQQEYDDFLRFISKIQDERKQEVFKLSEYSREEAASLLSIGKLDAYIVVKKRLSIYIEQNGLTQAIIESVADQYEQFLQICEETKTQLPLDELNRNTKVSYDLTGNSMESDNSMLYFYTLIGMCCFMTLTFGFYLSESIMSNQSRLAARMNCTPVGTLRRFLCGLLAAMTVSLFGLILVMCFIRYVLRFSFAFETNFVWLLVILGMLVGILFGYVFGSIFRGHKAWKDSVAMAIVLIFSFFAGIIRIDVSYYVKKHEDWFGYINPVNLVSDGLYSLLNQGNFFSYLVNLVILGVFSLILIVIALVQTGRRSYDRI